MVNQGLGKGKSAPFAARHAGEIPRFTVGLNYNRLNDIHLNYGGSRQSGISTSAACPAIFIFSGESGQQFGYHDDFDSDNIFRYTGEGQIGDMEFTKGNRAIRDHAADDRALHVFRSLGKGKSQRYIGEFVLANYSITRGPDRNNAERKIIIFHLLRVNQTQYELDEIAKPSIAIPLDEARKKAIAAAAGSAGTTGATAIRPFYERSKTVRDYVLMRASGCCEACNREAPFLSKDEKPYLEAHHTTRLSDGGPDHPRYVGAICPTCHREIHYGKNGAALNQRLKQRLAEIESSL